MSSLSLFFLTIMRKRMKLHLFIITKEEAAQIYKIYPNADITICSKRKRCGGKTYWCSEDTEYKKIINDLRNNVNQN